MRNLRYGLRMLGRNPGFTAVAVACLALGIGATTAIFSIVDAVLLRPLPYRDSGRLVRVFTEFPTFPNGGLRHFWVSPPEYLEIRRDTQSWQELEGWLNSGVNLAGSAEPVRAQASYVTGGMLPMLGVAPMMGRLPAAADDAPNAPLTAALSYALWQRAFGGDPAILGRDIRLNGAACTVIGVMPRGFAFPPGEIDAVELWLPLQLDPAKPGGRAAHSLSVLGRLRPGTTMAQAAGEMSRYVRNGAVPPGTGRHGFNPSFHPIVLAGLQDEVVRAVRLAMLVLLGAVVFVLLIACVNVANLLLARSEARRREIAVRAAIGAGTGELLRQFILEGILLSLAGAVAGLGLAFGGIRLLLATNAGSIPRAGEIGIDWRVLAFSLALSVATGILFGLAPLLHLRLRSLHETLRNAAGRAAGAVSASRFRSALVTGELALALVLLIGSALMIKAFWKLQAVDAGLNSSQVLTMRLSLPSTAYPDRAKANGFWNALLERTGGLPGVVSASIATGLPPSRPLNANDTDIEGFVYAPGGPLQNVDYWNFVSPQYFATVGARLIEGRFLDRNDGDGAPPAVVVNQTMARTFWPRETALGHRVRTEGGRGRQGAWRTIVGVVADIKNAGLDKPAGTELFIPYAQASTIPGDTGNFADTAYLILRTASDPMRLAAPARAQIGRLDRALPVSNLRTMEDAMSANRARPRFLTLVLALFSTVALTLAALGIYGVISYLVAQRTNEIGIRMALGAQPGDVLRMIGGAGLRLALAGTAIGGAGAFFLTRFLRGLLFGISAADPITFAAMVLTLAAVTLAACFIPARRASKVDPLVAIRYE
jgi:putative ABC transport system permease protein